jgi:hypothetical protein
MGYDYFLAEYSYETRHNPGSMLGRRESNSSVSFLIKLGVCGQRRR